MTIDMQTARRDIDTTQTMAQATFEEARSARREMDIMNQLLSAYVGRVDSIQIRVNETWESIRSMEEKVKAQSNMMRAVQVEQVQQSDLLRQILINLSPPPGDDIVRPSFQSPPL